MEVGKAFSAVGSSGDVVTGVLSGVAICVVFSSEVEALLILLSEGSKVMYLLGCQPNLSLGPWALRPLPFNLDWVV